MNEKVSVYIEDLEKIGEYLVEQIVDQNGVNNIVEEISNKLGVAEDIVFEVVADVQYRMVSKEAYAVERDEHRNELIEIEELVLQFFNDEKEREIELLTLVHDMQIEYAPLKEY